jgi:quercetin dioxygenase-like cupin family protein
VAGAGTLTVDGHAHAVTACRAVIVPKGLAREISAGPEGMRYLSVHLRRPGIVIG